MTETIPGTPVPVTLQSIRAFRRQCIIPGESLRVRRIRLHTIVENRAIDELAPKLGLIPPSEFRQLHLQRHKELDKAGRVIPYGEVLNMERGSGRTTTAILRALVRLQSGVNHIIFIGYDYNQAKDCCSRICQLLDQLAGTESYFCNNVNAVPSTRNRKFTIPLSARDSNLDTRLCGVLSRSIVIDPGAIQYISPEVMVVIEAVT